MRHGLCKYEPRTIFFSCAFAACFATVGWGAEERANGIAKVDPASTTTVEQWGIFEIALHGPQSGNPFVDVELHAEFVQPGKNIRLSPRGFYDGGGVYKIRFMPVEAGEWTWQSSSNIAELNGQSGKFVCTAPSANNHGPVRVREQFHFTYADGKLYYPFGTTAYGFTHQTDELDSQTLATLKTAPFNKVRFLVFPAWKEYDAANPAAFARPDNGEQSGMDFTRFDPAYFRRLEHYVTQLREMQIEADLIMLHPYDRGGWGYNTMSAETDDRYARYLVARLGAYRNVWWCLANEFTFLRDKTMADWDRLFQIVAQEDVYDHLLSIHNSSELYNYKQPWVTHVALQYYNAVRFERAAMIFRDIYGKPVVNDEINYEGNIRSRWGQLSGEEMTFRFWMAIVNGTYATHGESFQSTAEYAPWISRGGTLRGESASRIAFLRGLVEELGPAPLEPLDHYYTPDCAGVAGRTYLYYFGKQNLTEWEFRLPRGDKPQNGEQFTAEIIDTWNMTREKVPDVFEAERIARYHFLDRARKKIALPGKPYMAIVIRNVEAGATAKSEGATTTTLQRPATEAYE